MFQYMGHGLEERKEHRRAKLSEATSPTPVTRQRARPTYRGVLSREPSNILRSIFFPTGALNSRQTIGSSIVPFKTALYHTSYATLERSTLVKRAW